MAGSEEDVQAGLGSRRKEEEGRESFGRGVSNEVVEEVELGVDVIGIAEAYRMEGW